MTVRIVHRSELSPQTSQTPGMERLAAIAADTVGSKDLWAGVATMAPGPDPVRTTTATARVSFTC